MKRSTASILTLVALSVMTGCRFDGLIARYAETHHRHDGSALELIGSPSIQPNLRERDDARGSDRVSRRHFDLALRVGFPKLASTKQKLDRRLDWPLRADVFGVFHRPDTTIDRRTNFTLSSLYLGIGRQEEDWLAWTLYFGGGADSDKDHQRFLNANLDVAFRYATFYSGIMAEVYPWGLPELGSKLSLAKKIKQARPYLLTGIEIGYVSAEARGHYSLAPFRLYQDHLLIRDWLFSTKLGLGLGIPLDENVSFHLAGDYTYHFYRPEEYSGWHLISTLRWHF